MTLPVGAALLLALGAGMALVLGWSGDDPAMVWVSLAAGALAGILVGVAARSSGSEDDSA